MAAAVGELPQDQFGIDTSKLDPSEEQELASEAAPSAEVKQPPQEEQKKSNKRKLKLKVDGQDLEEEIDLDNEEELRKHLQLSKAAQKRMQEAAELKKRQSQIDTEIQEFIQHLRDPSKAAQILSDPRIGLDVKKFAQQIINQEIEEMQLSPEEKERRKLQAELESLRKEKEEKEKMAENERLTRVQQEYASQLEKDILSGLSKTSLPNKPFIIKRIVENLAVAMENGVDDVRVEDVLPIVEKQFKRDLKEMFDAFPEETIEQLIGLDNVDRLRKHRIRKMKSTKAQAPDTNVKEPVEKQKKSEQPVTTIKRDKSSFDFFKNLK